MVVINCENRIELDYQPRWCGACDDIMYAIDIDPEGKIDADQLIILPPFGKLRIRVDANPIKK